eukprot:9468240-Pyramimonas_sp.AAC.1
MLPGKTCSSNCALAPELHQQQQRPHPVVVVVVVVVVWGCRRRTFASVLGGALATACLRATAPLQRALPGCP